MAASGGVSPVACGLVVQGMVMLAVVGTVVSAVQRNPVDSTTLVVQGCFDS